MSIYFIQKKGFLDGDVDYLRHRLAASKKDGGDQYYRHFLTRLFFEGFALEEAERPPEARKLLGRIPYLNGGLFLPHQIEQLHGLTSPPAPLLKGEGGIQIPDSVFERLFAFFDQYAWYLDDRPLRADNEINPDVLGYIFEQYVNQKQMGAYYTKEDITGYICRNTILPFLFDKLATFRYDAVHPLPIKDVEPYIYSAVNQAEYLPTETEREYAARQKRLAQIRADFAAGKIANVNDLITYNLDIEKFARDWLRGLDDPLTLRAFYFECLKKLTVLDPTVGSGAFLFAAMNIVEPLYEICLDKMAQCAGPKYPDFRDELARVAEHPNRRYFIFKSIIVNNLYGVDIMDEATEICKLRLFLKLVAQVDDVSQIEPLPDIDFNIRSGNTLVGYASLEEVERAAQRSLFNVNLPKRIKETDVALRAFRDLQTQRGISARALAKAKADTQKKLAEIEAELNEALRAEYGARKLETFVESHRPFHWYVEFNSIMLDGGFDVIVGNPPYVEYKEVSGSYQLRGYNTQDCGNLFAYVMERCNALIAQTGRIGMIVPLSAFSTDRMIPLIKQIKDTSSSLYICNFGWRPGKLFDGVNLQLSIVLQQAGHSKPIDIFTTRYLLWESEARSTLFSKIEYCKTDDERLPGAVPKLGSSEARSILSKLRSKSAEMSAYFVSRSRNLIYYRRGGLYWKVFIDFETGSSEEKIICLKPDVDRYLIIAALSSNLWFWYFTATSDCRHLGNRDIDTFPFDTSALSEPDRHTLSKLGWEYVADLKRNAGTKTRVYKGTKAVDVIAFEVKKSKLIIDEIDRVLARHYGFTDEELDFIVNYDIKYRMGKEEAEE